MPVRNTIEWLSHIREFVFGMQDGVISTVGFLSGIQEAVADPKIVIIAGLAQVLTGAFSMGIGAYLSTKAEKEVFEGVREKEDKKRAGEPYLAQEELLKALEEEGLSREDGYRVVSILGKNRKVFRKTFYEKVLGISASDESRPAVAALVMFLAFTTGGIFPITPYFFELPLSLPLSIVFSCIALFGTGYLKGVLAQKTPYRSGMEFLIIALLSALFGYLIGLLLGYPV